MEMCAIYKYGNGNVLRMNVFFLLSLAFDALLFFMLNVAAAFMARGFAHRTRLFFPRRESMCLHVSIFNTFVVFACFMLGIFISYIHRGSIAS